MPEGDSYTKAAARITPLLLGQEIVSVSGSAPAVRRRSGQLVAATVDRIRTYGKNLLIDVDTGWTVRIHLGMPGRILATPDGGRLPGGHGLRAGLTTAAGTVSIISAPTVDVETPDRVASDLAHLGPDILADEFESDEAKRRLGLYRRDATVSELLLDQRVVAGIGNVYKCEALFLERIDPSRSVETLGIDDRLGLVLRARRIMLPNMLRGRRVTTGDPRRPAWVYDRRGEACLRCRTAIAQTRLGERVTYWCPSCQV